MIFLCALACFLNYADRINISVAIIPMSEEYCWTVTDQGTVLGAFFYGYLPMQIVGAELSKRYGGKIVLGASALWWSFFTLVTPLAADLGLPALLLARFLMGLGEGLALPTIVHFLAAWIAPEDRAFTMACIATGANLGTTFALLVCPAIVAWASWRVVFYAFGAAGFLWGGVWMRLARNGEGGAGGGAAAAAFSFDVRLYKKVVTSGACWAPMLCQFCDGFGTFGIMHWLPTFFKTEIGQPVQHLGITFLPYLVMALLANVAGWLSERVRSQAGLSLTAVRKLFSCVALSGAALFVVLFSRAQNKESAIILVTLCLAFKVLAIGGFEATYFDVAHPKYAGTVKALGNSFAALSGIVSMAYTSAMYEHVKSWRLVFASLGAVYLAGALAFALLGSATEVIHFPLEPAEHPDNFVIDESL